MKILIDLNIILDYLEDRAPFANEAEKILENEKNRKNVHDRVDLLSLAADEIDNNERNYADSNTL